MQSLLVTSPRFSLAGAALLLTWSLPANVAFAEDTQQVTVGVALGGSMTAGQAVPDGYENDDPDERGPAAIPSSGFGFGVSVHARRPITERSQLRAGVRTGYTQGKAMFDLADLCAGAGATPCVERGTLRGSAFFGAALIGGEAHLGNPDAVRPYLLGELGFGLAQLWPRARAAENNVLTCAVSIACEGADADGPVGRETGRVAVGPAAVVGAGIAAPTVPLRIEAAYVWHSLLGGAWDEGVSSPGTSLSMVEVSVGYLFGGG